MHAAASPASASPPVPGRNQPADRPAPVSGSRDGDFHSIAVMAAPWDRGLDRELADPVPGAERFEKMAADGYLGETAPRGRRSRPIDAVVPMGGERHGGRVPGHRPAIGDGGGRVGGPVPNRGNPSSAGCGQHARSSGGRPRLAREVGRPPPDSPPPGWTARDLHRPRPPGEHASPWMAGYGGYPGPRARARRRPGWPASSVRDACASRT